MLAKGLDSFRKPFRTSLSVFSFLRQLSTWHGNAVFAAERRAAAPLLLSAGQQIDRYPLPAEHSVADPQQWRGE